jgi:tetratricopeptide (TPR) repeat protein
MMKLIVSGGDPNELAVDRYRQVLALDPQNQQAEHGLQRVGQHYVALANAEMDRKDFDAATAHLEKAARILRGTNRQLYQARQRLRSLTGG